jgi:hypothetical protein
MIHHVSIPARNPRHVAKVLAELMGGRAYPFPGQVPDSFMAVTGDADGTMIEVYPDTVVLDPGEGPDGQVSARRADAPSRWPFHLLLSVKLDRASVEAIGAREGWRAAYLGRGAPGQQPVFHVIEFWVENSLMIEIATPGMLDAYTHTMRFEMLDAFGLQQTA